MHRPFVLVRLAAQRLHEIFDILLEDRRSFLELHRQRRVHDIGRGHADMEIARIVADRFRHAAQKRNDLMLDLGFDLANALHVEARLLANARDRGFGHFAQLGQALGGENFHFQPFLKAIFFRPDTAHLRPRVTRDHAC